MPKQFVSLQVGFSLISEDIKDPMEVREAFEQALNLACTHVEKKLGTPFYKILSFQTDEI